MAPQRYSRRCQMAPGASPRHCRVSCGFLGPPGARGLNLFLSYPFFLLRAGIRMHHDFLCAILWPDVSLTLSCSELCHITPPRLLWWVGKANVSIVSIQDGANVGHSILKAIPSLMTTLWTPTWTEKSPDCVAHATMHLSNPSLPNGTETLLCLLNVVRPTPRPEMRAPQSQ